MSFQDTEGNFLGGHYSERFCYRIIYGNAFLDSQIGVKFRFEGYPISVQEAVIFRYFSVLVNFRLRMTDGIPPLNIAHT